jgi:hypothetical protein
MIKFPLPEFKLLSSILAAEATVKQETAKKIKVLGSIFV